MNKNISNLHLEILKNKDLKLFSVKDIAVMKAYAIGRRGEYRDYFDLYTILRGKYIKLPEIIEAAKKVYGAVFEEKIFLTQLVYFDDLLDYGINPAPGKKIPEAEEVKKFLENLARAYVKK